MTGAGAGARMDGFSVHPYCYPQLPGEPFRDNLEQMVAAAEQGAGKPLPLWITEIGWPTQLGATGSDFLHQARCLVRAGLIAAAVPGVERVIWYDFKDDGRDVAYNENNFGLVHHQDFMLAPKPGYVAVANMIAMMDGRKVVSQAREGDLWRTVLDGDRGRVTVLWADQLDSVVKVPVPPDSKAVDMFGRQVAAIDGVEVTADPVFVVPK
jgi:hypothetical protein